MNVFDVIKCKKICHYNKKKIKISVMNMPFISSREAPLMKYAFFASLDEIEKNESPQYMKQRLRGPMDKAPAS